ncbi:MAG: PilT/PilU family type 4a pilus ATPase [Bacteriovoracaceae bacterium]|jgi:twitching motility protein PilT|nr:PilT/PilU family type 4a pilus ATPase [Bacteriovoracaceae bacterium]
MAFTVKHLNSLTEVAVNHSASDIHIRTDEPPCLRIRGDLVPIQTKDFKLKDVVDLAKILSKIDAEESVELTDLNEKDGSFEIENTCRLRFNIFVYNQQLGVILRIINSKVPTIESLGFSSIIKKIALQRRGLILVTGATGSGKSTTLAAMISYINRKRHTHIITIEDPVEYIYTQDQSRITQREIGIDTPSFASALRAALRQDPDIILIGEMRDKETISIALKAAETGHVVLSTVHTTDAVRTVGRIISMFPEGEQEDVRKRLADNLYATISQRMLKGIKKSTLCIAQEIMITSPGVKECIEGVQNIHRLSTIISKGRGKSGNQSQTFDQHIMDLYQADKISKEVALEAATSGADFIQKLLVEE